MAIKFDSEFVEARMEQHRRLQHEAEYALIEEIIDEIQALPKRQPKSARLFEVWPESTRTLAARQ